MFVEPRTCPRCDDPIDSNGRGRPRKWCTDRCRKLASEERRAAERGAIGLEVREQIREQVVEKTMSRPLSPDGAVERVLGDWSATAKLLRTLAHRIRSDTLDGPHDKFLLSQRGQALGAPMAAYREAMGLPEPTPAAMMNPGRAVAQVLSSPRSCREVIDGLTRQARAGTFDPRIHGATVEALSRLVTALTDEGIRPR